MHDRPSLNSSPPSDTFLEAELLLVLPNAGLRYQTLGAANVLAVAEPGGPDSSMMWTIKDIVDSSRLPRRASLTCTSTTAANCPRAGCRMTTSSPSTTMGAAMSRPSSSSVG